MQVSELLEIAAGQQAFEDLVRKFPTHNTIHLTHITGSSFPLNVALTVARYPGIHIVICDDRDSAAYFCNDLYYFADQSRVFFFPTGYKRSIKYGQEDPSGIVQRTAALNAISNFTDGYLIICTYPEALAEKVVDREELKRNTVTVTTGENISLDFLRDTLAEYGFVKVDFVYEPGQYSVRGGIFDVFSFTENIPFRIDFFGDEIDSIRTFDINSQLSLKKLDKVEIVPNLKNLENTDIKVSLARYAGDAVYWINDLDHTVKSISAIRKKVLGELEEPSMIDKLVTGPKSFIEDTSARKFLLRSMPGRDRQPEITIDFETSPQPSFNKQFDILADDIYANSLRGYDVYLLSENKVQIERLQNIMNSIGRQEIRFGSLPLTLHEGFVSRQMKLCLYTDHQIFDRYHRYKLDRQIQKNESLTIAELNNLKIGDYVVHIDHGVGRYGGLVRSLENGKVTESIKLVYKDNDVLLVNVHALHRISRYKDRDSDPPRVYKLGSGAWQRLKNATKKAVKDIARELIALYARRKAVEGYAFSRDSYMQQELEASFIYEDTPDQQKATEAVKKDMETPHPMDRLICGDVGFGKTEIAVRAAFKAVSDSKQVAVLVPTTILSLQHYRTFSERLKDFPVRIEHLSRSKTAKETREILKELADGKIDILIGTHKITGKDVKFKELGLLIIDEEQKFGVAVKEKLRQMAVGVDTLTLTATPIPRTLQFSLMGSRDLSVISTPPPNRQPVVTESHLFDKEIIKEALEFELARHGQIYFVHNRVEDIYGIESMIKELVPGVRTVVGHGQMDPKELEKKIMDFIYGEFDVLIATTIIENGIDIPNANTMIINNAQNFGLSDLHQLRGRVGRSNRKAFCYLLSPPEEMLSTDSKRRLRALEEFSELGSGFNIAMQDLDIRGAGNLLGAEQSGFIADIGFQTYQKILDEAMDELRAEGLAGGTNDNKESSGEVRYLTDAHIETDEEAYIPDSYVSQGAEKLRLYKELDSLTGDQQAEQFTAMLRDRFGPLPEPVNELINVVRLRRYCIDLGFEKARIRNGLMILRFLENTDSPYYKSDKFMAILKYITGHPSNFILKQNNNKLSITVRNIKDADTACGKLKEIKIAVDAVTDRQVADNTEQN